MGSSGLVSGSGSKEFSITTDSMELSPELDCVDLVPSEELSRSDIATDVFPSDDDDDDDDSEDDNDVGLSSSSSFWLSSSSSFCIVSCVASYSTIRFSSSRMSSDGILFPFGVWSFGCCCSVDFCWPVCSDSNKSAWANICESDILSGSVAKHVLCGSNEVLDVVDSSDSVDVSCGG